MNQIVIRKPELNDAAQVAFLMEQLGYPIDEENMKKNIQLYSTFPHQKAWIAVCENQIIGCIAVAIVHYFHASRSILRVIAMIVDQDHRRKGIGKKLMEVAEEYALSMGCSHVELSSGAHRKKLGSHDFYRSLGYVELNDEKKFFGKKLFSKRSGEETQKNCDQ